MHYILYPFSDGPQLIDGVLHKGMTIATTRPETMMADGALAVHPEDARYIHLLGQDGRSALVRPANSHHCRRLRRPRLRLGLRRRSPVRMTSTTTPARSATVCR
jgi:hypothetical protein